MRAITLFLNKLRTGQECKTYANMLRQSLQLVKANTRRSPSWQARIIHSMQVAILLCKDCSHLVLNRNKAPLNLRYILYSLPRSHVAT